MDKKEKELAETFGLNVRYQREKLKLKQEELAEALEVSSVYISNIENGKHNISLFNALKFSEYFNVTVEYLSKEK